MAKAQDEQIVAFRNFMVLGSLGLIAIVACLYLIGVFIIFMVQHRTGLHRLFAMDAMAQTMYITNVLTRYWQAVFENFTKLGFAGAHFFIPKVII